MRGQSAAFDLAGNIKCPVTGFFGSLDMNPSLEDADICDAALTKAGVEHIFRVISCCGTQRTRVSSCHAP